MCLADVHRENKEVDYLRLISYDEKNKSFRKITKCLPSAEAWFPYIVIHRRCPCGLIVGGQRWIKSFVFLKSFSPSAITDNR